MQKLEYKIHYRTWLGKWIFFFCPIWVTAITFGSHIFTRKHEHLVDATLVYHELIHVCQYKKYGLLGFFYRYMIKEFRVPYREKTFEKEAYENQEDFTYIERVYGYEVEM